MFINNIFDFRFILQEINLFLFHIYILISLHIYFRDKLSHNKC